MSGRYDRCFVEPELMMDEFVRMLRLHLVFFQLVGREVIKIECNDSGAFRFDCRSNYVAVIGVWTVDGRN